MRGRAVGGPDGSDITHRAFGTNGRSMKTNEEKNESKKDPGLFRRLLRWIARSSQDGAPCKG
jgi:hypothetical protein